jgi:short-subunit dehydrogenase
MNIQDQVVIITGASEGIGAATARLLAKHDAKVVLAARSLEKLNVLKGEIEGSGGTALAIQTDMRKPDDIKALVRQTHAQLGRVDVLINNAAQALGGPIEHLNLESYQQILELNIFGVLRAMQAVIPIMRAQGGGLILNVSSMVSKMALRGIGGYASTKYALNGLSATARAELTPDNIRVILVYPRITATAFVQNGIGYGGFGVARPQGGNPNAAPGMVIDSAEAVAGKILDAIQNEPAEQFME